MVSTIIDEILSVLADNNSMSSKEIASELKLRGISLEARTIRYHLKKMEEKGLITKTENGKRKITSKGLKELKRKSAFDRLGEFSERIEYNAYFCNFDLYRMEGTVPTNLAIIDKNKYDEAMEILSEMQDFKFLVHKFIAIADEGERLGDVKIPKGKFGIACISNTIYDVILKYTGVLLTPEFAALLSCERGEIKGITELISYTGTTLSPGWLFLRSGLTSVYKCLKTGSGEIITAIRSFSGYAIDIVKEEMQLAKSRGFGGAIYVLHPSSKLFKLPPGKRARFIVAAGLNYLAPLQELGFNPKMKVIEAFIDFSNFKSIDNI